MHSKILASMCRSHFHPRLSKATHPKFPSGRGGGGREAQCGACPPGVVARRSCAERRRNVLSTPNLKKTRALAGG